MIVGLENEDPQEMLLEWMAKCQNATRGERDYTYIPLDSTLSAPKSKSFYDSKFISKNKSSYPILKVHLQESVSVKYG